jgi:NADPH-dependent 2,4-dienoyl-CoA reductase/sulfur reductase-like enzyme
MASKKQSDLVLVATGVKPASDLAVSAGVLTGFENAVRVDSFMRTNVPDIYAAGDCAETWHRVPQQYRYLPLGTTSHKQGRIAGENAVGGSKRFAGSVATQVVKVFDLTVARTGLRDHEAKLAGFNPRTVETKTWDHKAYYPVARQITLRVTGDMDSGRLLGAQIIGSLSSEVAKRLDIFAIALFHRMSVEDLSELDLSYAPPLSTPWDPVQLAAHEWCRGPSRSFD